MYELTGFTLKELQMLNMAVSDLIDKKNHHLSIASSFPSGYTKEDLNRKANDGLSELREMNVRILTAIEMVKSSESIQSN
jgi:hypothetical protein